MLDSPLLAVGELTKKIKRGKHTTRRTEILSLGDDTYFVDTCGFSMLDAVDVPPEELRLYFDDMEVFRKDCRFNMCTHTDEPDCAVKAHLGAGVGFGRYERYKQIFNELNERRKTSMIKVAPSILSADFGKMAEAVQKVKEWGADLVHCDVMDGVYVPNITFGMPMVKSIRKYTDQQLDVHLMITRPEKYVGQFCDAGADWVTFHPEASEDVEGALEEIKSKGVKCGLVVNADQPFSIVEPYLDKIDMLLIMTVQAGFGGQSFKEDCLEKVRRGFELKKLNDYDYEIEIDGGVSPSNIQKCKDAGATIVVAGSSVFKAENPSEAVKAMQI